MMYFLGEVSQSEKLISYIFLGRMDADVFAGKSPQKIAQITEVVDIYQVLQIMTLCTKPKKQALLHAVYWNNIFHYLFKGRRDSTSRTYKYILWTPSELVCLCL